MSSSVEYDVEHEGILSPSESIVHCLPWLIPMVFIVIAMIVHWKRDAIRNAAEAERFYLRVAFDINGVWKAADSTAGNASNAELANEILAKSIVGRITEGVVKSFTPNPRNKFSWEDPMYQTSYFQYLENQEKKTAKEQAYKCRNTFPSITGETMQKVEQLVEHKVFLHSISNVMKQLLANPDIRLIWITFGNDGEDVKREVSTINQYNNNLRQSIVWEDWKNIRSVITQEPEEECCLCTINCTHKLKFPSMFQKEGSEWLSTPDTFTTNHLTSGNFIMCQADFEKWKNSGKKKEAGKMLSGHTQMRTIMFDDNDCFTSCGPDVRFVRVNTMAAIIDNKYFENILFPELERLEIQNRFWARLRRAVIRCCKKLACSIRKVS